MISKWNGLKRTPLKRKFYVLKRSPIKRKRPTPRRGPMRDPKYLRWLKIQRCVNCGCFRTRWNPIDPAHTENNGMSSKGPDSSCAPLCRMCHRRYDRGRALFEIVTGLDMGSVARRFYAFYLASGGADLRGESNAFDREIA